MNTIAPYKPGDYGAPYGDHCVPTGKLPFSAGSVEIIARIKLSPDEEVTRDYALRLPPRDLTSDEEPLTWILDPRVPDYFTWLKEPSALREELCRHLLDLIGNYEVLASRVLAYAAATIPERRALCLELFLSLERLAPADSFIQMHLSDDRDLFLASWVNDDRGLIGESGLYSAESRAQTANAPQAWPLALEQIQEHFHAEALSFLREARPALLEILEKTRPDGPRIRP